MILLRIGIVLTAVLGVAACTSDVRLTQQEISPSYRPGEFAYAGADRDMRVIVVGNPFGGEQERSNGPSTIKCREITGVPARISP